jgi:glycosyltransferase involved in cell wall biosynthesis
MLRRIAYVVRVFPQLSETFIAGEAAEVLQRGVEVRILSLEFPGDKVCHDIVARAGLAERTVYGYSESEVALQAFRPELIHAHFATHATAVARGWAAALGVPFTFTAHGYDVYRRPPVDFADRAAAAAAVVTVSEANARYLTSRFDIARSRIHVIPCGIDTIRFQPDGRPTGTPLIVCVARLKPVKNLGLLLDACARLIERGVDFRCVLVGDGPMRNDLLEAKGRLGLWDVVELVGAVEQTEVIRWWRRASVAALTSESEGMPVCLMEAAACGVPAVATAVGGVPELIEDGVTGLLVAVGDSQAMAAALERLLRDPVLAARLGRAARRRAEQRFSIIHHVDRLLEVWRRAVSGDPQ